MIYKEQEYICGRMNVDTKDNGIKIKCMEKVKSHEPMAGRMRETMSMIKNMVLEHSLGVMEESI